MCTTGTLMAATDEQLGFCILEHTIIACADSCAEMQSHSEALRREIQGTS